MSTNDTMDDSKQSRYVIGIDLGTTNNSVAYIDRASRASRRTIRFLDIPQVVAEGEVASRSLLPSFLYFPGTYELTSGGSGAGALALPWDTARDYTAGEYAQKQAARVAGRVVSSAKSWLCHRKVNRTARILPWGGAEDVRTVSPVEASSLYLSHLREAWNWQLAKDDSEKLMENQEIVLTVPASFDEVARELTVEAARSAGLHRIVLLEEPQAAFYSWLLSYEASWRKHLRNISLILVFDVGGGTTDFTLIQVAREEEELSLKRIAVGEHLMLGGDNMDLAMARHVEEKYMKDEKKLDSQRWSLLCHECRGVKERVLEDTSFARFSITLPGRGSRLIGEAIQAGIDREEAMGIIMNGFFPEAGYDDEIQGAAGLGFKEWGLPYASDPAITRHAASFLKTHLKDSMFPDALLFNGGALKSEKIQSRLVHLLTAWGSERTGDTYNLRLLSSKDLDLAVSRGAAYFGMVRHGEGVRIGGGTPRSYYVGIELEKAESDEPEGAVSLLCLIPKDLPTEREVDIEDKEFSLLLGRPVSFSLYSSTSREEDIPGQILELSGEKLEKLPPLFMVLESQAVHDGEIPVHLRAWVTEIGTLELWCVSRAGEERWKLQFALQRAAGEPEVQKPAEPQKIDPGLVKKSRELITTTFTRKPGKITSEDIKPRGLLSALEDLAREKREQWSTALNREIFDSALKVLTRRRSDPEYEASWLNIAGFSLRPGFGYPLDDWRISQLWPIFTQWLQFNRDQHCRLEWWIMWRRVAGGLDEQAQEEVFQRISPFYFPGKKHIKTFTGPPPNRIESQEVLRMAACLEKISRDSRILLGEYVMEHLKKKEDYSYYWLIARIGARIPFAGSIHHVVDRETVQQWISAILALKWHDPSPPSFALARIARLTGDRERDIDEALRLEVAERMKEEKCDERYIAPLLEVVEEESQEIDQIFGESLPLGLIFKGAVE